MILLDQFPRNCFRGSGHMYATDGLARHHARAAIEAGHDQAVEQAVRSFFYLPLMHSEDIADQNISVERCTPLGGETLKYARHHREIVERVLRADPSKVAIAVATVVLFGTFNIFLYPMLYPHLGLDPAAFGLYAGATVHEVAQVVAVGSAVSPETADAAVIVKLTRVLLLVPVLLVLGWQEAREGGERAMVIPWFALGFLAVVALNSVIQLPGPWRAALLTLDTLLLATAMAALGVETRIAKLRALGPRPLLLAGVLFLWLSVGGYLLVRAVT